ncbi:uncharacterized protein F5147DRAFT_652937 [Suillus discolor]|uniref:Uncharacterized protein n=1 Tax=Suillus discolor TaxID=1912936 RepID=A0A9P7F875_9AGAM|nr:uncharacterized protein F5147DRAFT_652937 [Suillus discolor]KAG2108215.1 hypothetical protein F5147DRAFT_652937 [Suillus discolor]
MNDPAQATQKMVQLAKCRLGVAYINILKIQKSLVFGKYNNHPQVKREVNKLITFFKKEGILVMQEDTAIPMMLSRTCLKYSKNIMHGIVSLEKYYHKISEMKKLTKEHVTEYNSLCNELAGLQGALILMGKWGIIIYDKDTIVVHMTKEVLIGILRLVKAAYKNAPEEEQLQQHRENCTFSTTLAKVLSYEKLVLMLALDLLPLGPYFHRHKEFHITLLAQSINVLMEMFIQFIQLHSHILHLLASNIFLDYATDIATKAPNYTTSLNNYSNYLFYDRVTARITVWLMPEDGVQEAPFHYYADTSSTFAAFEEVSGWFKPLLLHYRTHYFYKHLMDNETEVMFTKLHNDLRVIKPKKLRRQCLPTLLHLQNKLTTTIACSQQSKPFKDQKEINEKFERKTMKWKRWLWYDGVEIPSDIAPTTTASLIDDDHAIDELEINSSHLCIQALKEDDSVLYNIKDTVDLMIPAIEGTEDQNMIDEQEDKQALLHTSMVPVVTQIHKPQPQILTNFDDHASLFKTLQTKNKGNARASTKTKDPVDKQGEGNGSSDGIVTGAAISTGTTTGTDMIKATVPSIRTDCGGVLIAPWSSNKLESSLRHSTSYTIKEGHATKASRKGCKDKVLQRTAGNIWRNFQKLGGMEDQMSGGAEERSSGLGNSSLGLRWIFRRKELTEEVQEFIYWRQVGADQ